MRYSCIEVHYGELWLRGRNRPRFIDTLIGNIAKALEGEKCSIENIGDRLAIMLNKGADIESIKAKLGHVFGISWYASSLIVENDIDKIIEGVKHIVKESSRTAFKVQANRSYKRVSFNSIDIVSAMLREKSSMGFLMDKKASSVIYVSVTRKGTFIHVGKEQGLGGLPVGVSGRAVVLISGGIDSPVAAFMAMKRGLEPIYLHIHPFPNNMEAKSSKIGSIVKLLDRYHPAQIYYAPYFIFQSYLLRAEGCARYENVVFKRFMLRLAEKIALRENANAIVTGESIGQVSSQTIENMLASSYGIKKLVVRPLIGFDKNEIIECAKGIGTYELSIQKYKDVCSINVRNPKTKVKPEVIESIYSRASLERAEDETLKRSLLASY
ncbi:MAG: tRNA uracil 4-sulfurtransferase ThiI [Candidatus Micrarchaeia archaeon]